MWGPKQDKVRKPSVSRLYCWIFTMRVSEEERSARDGVYRHVAVPRGKQDHAHAPSCAVYLCAGYIQSPGFDEKTRYPTAMDAWLRLRVPAGHDVMISFLHFDVGQKLGTFMGTDRVQVQTV